MKNLNRFLISLLFVSFAGTTRADSVDGTIIGNHGNIVSATFFSHAWEIEDFLRKAPAYNIHKIDLDRLSSLLKELKIEVKDELPEGVDAINYFPGNRLLILSGEIWKRYISTFPDATIKKLVYHELLYDLGFKDTDYIYSREISKIWPFASPRNSLVFQASAIKSRIRNLEAFSDAQTSACFWAGSMFTAIEVFDSSFMVLVDVAKATGKPLDDKLVEKISEQLLPWSHPCMTGQMVTLKPSEIKSRCRKMTKLVESIEAAGQEIF